MRRWGHLMQVSLANVHNQKYSMPFQQRMALQADTGTKNMYGSILKRAPPTSRCCSLYPVTERNGFYFTLLKRSERFWYRVSIESTLNTGSASLTMGASLPKSSLESAPLQNLLLLQQLHGDGSRISHFKSSRDGRNVPLTFPSLTKVRMGGFSASLQLT